MAYHQNYHHGHEQYEYAPAPEATFVVPPPPQSAFSPGYHHDPYAGPRSSSRMLDTAVVVEATPMMDHAGLSRSSSRARPEYEVANGRRYLAVGGYNKSSLGRSNSERGRESRERGQIVVESSRRGHSRSRSDQKAYHYDVAQRAPRKKYYHDDDNYSTYSGTSSYGHNDSRGHSRSVSRHRPRQAHSRSSSRGSSDFHDDRYSVEPYLKPSRAEEELVEKLKDVQLKLDKVQQMTEKRRLEESKKNSEKAMNEEIERKVQEQIKKQKQADEDAARKQKEALEAERQRIADAAKKLLEEQAAAMKKKQEAEEAEKKRLQEIIEAERAKYQAASMGKKTYTRFSKTHLCKEALEERSIPFTEEVSLSNPNINQHNNTNLLTARLLPRSPFRREARAAVPLVQNKGDPKYVPVYAPRLNKFVY
jgi:hypothetical protein